MPRMTIVEALEVISRHRTDEVVVATMSAGYLWPRYSKSERDFVHTTPMGGAPSIGLGLALGRPDLRVLVLDGDGSLRMNLGVLLTVAEQAPPNFVHMVFENGVYNLTGGQPVPGHQRPMALAEMARSAGYRNVHMFQDVETLDLGIQEALRTPGPTFISVRVSPAFDAQEATAVRRSPAAQARRSRQGWTYLRDTLRSRPAR